MLVKKNIMFLAINLVKLEIKTNQMWQEVHRYNGVFSSCKNNVNPVIFHKVYEARGNYTKENSPSQKHKYCVIPLI